MLKADLRTYPAVTVLRNKSKALAEQRGFQGVEYWEIRCRLEDRI
jgi:hypothetical protein